MLFWVFVVLVVAMVIALAFYFFDYGFDIASLILWIVASGILSFLLLLGFMGLGQINANELKATSESRYELRAVDSGSASQGRAYFLAGAYVKDKRVLNYIIRNDKGASELGYTPADKSQIWEDQPEKPYMIVIKKEYGNWWFNFDAGYRTDYEYHYHIPAGSVKESTVIDNK